MDIIGLHSREFLRNLFWTVVHSECNNPRAGIFCIAGKCTRSLFYKGQAVWDDITYSGEMMGQLISKFKNLLDSEEVLLLNLGVVFQLKIF